jgi:hypothetical protein
MSKKVKVIIIVVAALALIWLGMCIAGEMYVNAAPERHIKGSWEGVATFENSKFKNIEDDGLKMTFDRKGKAILESNTETIEYDWQKQSGYFSTDFGYEYVLTEGDISSAVFSKATDPFVLCEQLEGGAVKATLFLKEGNDAVINEDTDFEALLEMNKAEELGVFFISDRQAMDYIQGEWVAVNMFFDGDKSMDIPFGTITAVIDGNDYNIIMFAQDSPGKIEYSFFANNICFYNMDGEYEEFYFCYDDASETLLLYDEEANEGITFYKN